MTDVRQQGQAEQGGPPKPGTPVIVDVFARDANGSVEFSHDWRFDGGNSKGGGRIDIPAKKTGEPGTPIHFHLHDDTNMLRFVSHADDVIWVDRNGCPQSQAKDSEITNIQPSPNLLRVYDENEVKCELHYNLRFEPDPDKYYYDPEIRNGGTV
jgi:hypothetical protein